MGRRGRLDYVNSAPMLPAFKPLPKVRDCTLLLSRKGRAPHLVGCVAEIAVTASFEIVPPSLPSCDGSRILISVWLVFRNLSK